MDTLDVFWNEVDKKKKKKKETQIERYQKNDAPEGILRFIKLGGGPSLGCTSEKYCRFVFDILKERIKKDTTHDHTLKINGKLFKIEQKTSTLNCNNDYRWQHISLKHNWDILICMSIGYKDIKFYGLTKHQLIKLVSVGKITNQGSKDKSSEQGNWFWFKNVKNNMTILETNNDIKTLCRKCVNN